MRLTALCVYGTLLALTCLSSTTGASGEGDVLGDKGYGPCAATLQLEGPCRQEQEEITCPYLVSLPPLTVHLPSQLRELEKIVKDLQSLKDDVDQLRKMCADCTVRQTESECGTQRERENVNLNEGTERQEDERNWVNERYPERLKDVGDVFGSDRVNVETTMEGDGDSDSEKKAILEERGRKKWEAERESIKAVVKENEKTETLLEVVEKDGKTQTEGAEVKDKLGQAKLPTAGGNRKTEGMARERVVEVNNKETERNKEKDKMGDSMGDGGGVLESGKARKITTDIKTKKTGGSDQPTKQHAIKETDEKTNEDGGGDGIKMSEDHEERTNKEREQHWEERTTKKENAVKVVQNNEKPKQSESTGHTETEKTIKKGEAEAGSREIKTDGVKVVQSVQRDSDGEPASNKAIERADFVSVSQNPRLTVSSAPRPRPSDSSKATTVTSLLPFPPSSGWRLITDDVQAMTIAAHGPSAQSTGNYVADVSPTDADQGNSTTSRPPPTATVSPVDVPRLQITSVTAGFTSSTRLTPRAGFQGQISSTVATTTTSTLSQNLFTTSVGVTDRSQWTVKNISSNTDSGVKPRPSQGAKATEKHQHGIRPEADKKLKNPKNDHKPEGTSPDKKSKYNQKQKLPLQKLATGQKPRPNKDRLQVHMPKPDQRVSLDDLTTYKNLTNNSAPKHDEDHTAVQNKFNVQKPKSQPKIISPVPKPTSHQGPGTANTTGSDKAPLTDQLNSKPVKNPSLKPVKNKPKQTPEKVFKSKEKTNPDLRTESNERFTPVQEAESETAERVELTPKPNQESVTELMGNSDENPSPELKSDQDLPPGQNLLLDHIHTHTDQKPKSSQKIPVINKNSTLGRIPKLYQKRPELSSGKKTKPNVKTKPGQSPQKQQGLKTPQLGEMPRLSQKSVPTEIPEVGSNKTKPRLSPGHGPTLKPGATSVQKPGPAVVPKSSPEIKTDKDPSVSKNIADDTQNFQIDRPATSGHVKVRTEVTLSPGDTKKSTTLPPNTSNRPKTGPFPLLHTVSEGFTVSPDSRSTSDLGPQTAGQPSSIPMTTRPNKIIHGILPSVIASTIPGSTKLSKTTIFNNAEERAHKQTPQPQKIMIPVLSSGAQTTSTLITDIRLTTPATSDPKVPAAEYSTPGAHELRVKINQVAAFPSDSQSSSGRLLDMRRKEQPQDDHGRRRSDDRLPTWVPSKVTAVKRDCSDHLVGGGTKSGVYLVTPDKRSNSFPVFCDMELEGGGWTLLQRRQDGSVSFNRTWAEYRSGFGEVDGGEFWLGNNMIHLLTRDRDMVLRVELEDFDGVMEYAEYERFKVASERLRFRLTVGGYSGTAGDALRFSKTYDHNNRPFTTPDRDNDRYPSGNCGAYYSSGWWFDACMAANLNGRYYLGKYTGVRDGIFWGTWHNISIEYYPTNERRSFKTVRMMIRPKGFAP